MAAGLTIDSVRNSVYLSMPRDMWLGVQRVEIRLGESSGVLYIEPIVNNETSPVAVKEVPNDRVQVYLTEQDFIDHAVSCFSDGYYKLKRVGRGYRAVWHRDVKRMKRGTKKEPKTFDVTLSGAGSTITFKMPVENLLKTMAVLQNDLGGEVQ